MKSFKDIRPGDRVIFFQHNGTGPKGPEFRRRVATVNPLLIFDDHVVVSSGACGQVVNESNFIGIQRGK